MALDDDTVRFHQEGVTHADGVVVIDDSAAAGAGRCVRVPFKKLAAPKYDNIAALGVVAALLGLDKSVVSEAVVAHFGRKDAIVVETNHTALEAA